MAGAQSENAVRRFGCLHVQWHASDVVWIRVSHPIRQCCVQLRQLRFRCIRRDELLCSILLLMATNWQWHCVAMIVVIVSHFDRHPIDWQCGARLIHVSIETGHSHVRRTAEWLFLYSRLRWLRNNFGLTRPNDDFVTLLTRMHATRR